MIEIFQPLGLSEFKLSKTDLGYPLTLPYDIQDDKKSEILNMLVYGFRDHNPRLLWVDWTEIDLKSGKISEIKDVKLDEKTVLCIRVKSEKELEEVYKNIRWFESLITVIDVRSKAAGKVNRKWLDKMKQTAYNAVRSAIFKRKVVDPKLFENFPFPIALKTFEDPIDVVEFFDSATIRLLDGAWTEIAAKDAIADILGEKLSKLNVNELKSVLMFLKSEEMEDEAIDGLESKGFVRVYHGEMIPSQSLKALKDPRIMERSFGTIIDSIDDEGLREDYKALMATMEPWQGGPEPMMRMQDAREDISFVVELWDIESELAEMGLPEEMLNDPEKLIDAENKVLLVESGESVRSKALVFRAFGYMEKGDLMRAGRDLETACKVNPEIIRNASPLLLRIGEVYSDAGRYGDAERCYLNVLEISKEAEYDDGTATSLYRLGSMHQTQGRYNEAATMYQESLKISEELGDRSGIAITLHQLGMIHHDQGRYDEAVTMYQESLKIFGELGDRSGIASTLHQLGMIHHEQGRYEEAATMYQESLEIKEELGDRSGIASTLHQLGMIHHDQGRYDEAVTMYQESLKIFEELGDKRGISSTLHQLGMIHHEQGRYEEAATMYQESLEIKEELGDKRGIAITLHQLGMIHQDQGRYDEAVTMYQESQKITEELGDRSGIASTLHQLGNVHYAQGRYEEAATMYQESLKISEELGDRSGIASTLGQMGRIFHAQKNYKEALRCYLNAFTIFDKLNSSYKDFAGRHIAALKEEIGDALFDKYYEEVTADE